MFTAFDLQSLQNLLRDFYRITNIRIIVFDSNYIELTGYPKQCAPFCTLIRATKEGRAACDKCDRDACLASLKKKATHIYRCHAGLTEAVVPLFVGNVLVGYLMFCHVFAYENIEEGWKTIRKCCADYPLDFPKLKQTCSACPQVPEDFIQSASRILHAIATHLATQQMITLQKENAASRLDDYLTNHFAEPITSQLLCKELRIGRSNLFSMAKQLYGCGITQQIIKLRMERAKTLLLEYPEMRISDIAFECGYLDYNYFIAVFSRNVGQPPNTYRKTHKRETSYDQSLHKQISP